MNSCRFLQVTLHCSDLLSNRNYNHKCYYCIFSSKSIKYCCAAVYTLVLKYLIGFAANSLMLHHVNNFFIQNVTFLFAVLIYFVFDYHDIFLNVLIDCVPSSYLLQTDLM